MVFGLEVPNIPLFITLLIILSFIFWSKFLSKDGKIIPKTGEEFILIFLILGLFVLNFAIPFILILFLAQRFLFINNWAIIGEILDWAVIFLFFIIIFCFSTLSKKRRKHFLIISSHLLPSVTLGLLIPSIIFVYMISYSFMSCVSVFSLILGIFFLSIGINSLLFEQILNEKKFGSNFIGHIRLFVSLSLGFLIFLMIIIPFSYTALTPEDTFLQKSYIIDGKFSDYSPFATKISEISYSKIIFPKAKRIYFDINPKLIQINGDTRRYFSLSILKKDGSQPMEVISSEDLNQKIPGDIVYNYYTGNLLFLEISSNFLQREFDQFLIRGAVMENISNEYQYSRNRNLIEPDKEIFNVSLVFNNSLKLPAEHRDIILHSSWIKQNNFSSCKIVFFYSELNESICEIENYNDFGCRAICGNWNFDVVKSNDAFFFISNTNNVIGNLKININFDCTQII